METKKTEYLKELIKKTAARPEFQAEGIRVYDLCRVSGKIIKLYYLYPEYRDITPTATPLLQEIAKTSRDLGRSLHYARKEHPRLNINKMLSLIY